MKQKALCLIVSAILLTGCGGSAPEPIPVKVTVKDPNAPAKTSSDLTGGQHLDLSTPQPVESPSQPSQSIKSQSSDPMASSTTSPSTADNTSDSSSQTSSTSNGQTDPNYVNMYEVHCDENNVCTRLSKTPIPPTPEAPHAGTGKAKLYCDAGAQPGGILPPDCPVTYYPL